MFSPIDLIHRRLMPALSLEGKDECWQSSWQNSTLGRAFEWIRQSLAKSPLNRPAVGTFLQKASFWLVLVLLLVLAAPQFANDKEGLALIVAGAFSLRVVGRLLGGKEQYTPTAMDAIVLLFLAVNIVATFASHYLVLSLKGLAKNLVYVVSYFLFVWSFQQNRTQRSLTALAVTLLGALAVSLYGLYQYKMGVAPLATWEDPSVEDKATRIYSTLGNPNLLAGYLVPLIPVSLGVALSCLGLNNWRKWMFVPASVTAGAIMLAAFLTGSRGGFIGIGAGLAAMAYIAFTWFWQARPKWRLPLVIAAIVLPLIAIAAVHFALPQVESRFLSIFRGSEHSSNAYRMHVWRAAWHMFEDSWWIGVGVGNQAFRMAYGLYMRSGFDALGAYCVPLEVAVETGIVGLATFVALLVATAARGHVRFWNSQDWVEKWVTASSFAGVIAMMAHGVVDTVFYRPQVQLLFWLLIATTIAGYRKVSANSKPAEPVNSSEAPYSVPCDN